MRTTRVEGSDAVDDGSLIAMRRKEFPNPRPLTPRERAVLDALLAPDFEDAGAFREQAAEIQVGDTCACGCASIDFADESLQSPMRILTEAIMKDGTGEIILFSHHSRLAGRDVLSGIECFWYSGDSMTELPPPDEFDVRVHSPVVESGQPGDGGDG